MLPTRIPHSPQLLNLAHRTAFIERFKNKGIFSELHYFPLHSSPRGQMIGRAAGETTQ